MMLSIFGLVSEVEMVVRGAGFQQEFTGNFSIVKFEFVIVMPTISLVLQYFFKK